jgi:plastocyanin
MTRLSARLIAATTLVLLGLLAGSLGSMAAATGHAVSIVDGAFRPTKITIKVGDSITWTNRGYALHDVFFDAFHSKTLSPGKSYFHTFSKAGSFAYVCSIHGFGGTVVVQRSAPSPKPTPKPTQKATPRPTPRPTAAAAATPTATTPASSVAPATATPSPSPVAAVAASPTDSPSSGGSPATPGSGGTSGSGPLLVLLALLLAGGVIGLGWRLNRGRG